MEQFTLNGPSFDKIFSHLTYKSIPKSWEQPFLFKGLSNSLQQEMDGPCGLMASIQSRMLILSSQNPNMSPKHQLIEALLDIQFKIRKTFIFCINFDTFNKNAVFKGTSDRRVAGSFLWDSNWHQSPNAILLFVISIIVLLGPTWFSIYALQDTFITEDGKTNLTLLLLLLTGQPLDSFQDGNKVMGGILIKGITSYPEIGFLSIAEGEDIQKPGNFLKRPQYPIWIAYYGGHFTVIQYARNGLFEYNALDKTQLWVPLSSKNPFYDKINELVKQYYIK